MLADSTDWRHRRQRLSGRSASTKPNDRQATRSGAGRGCKTVTVVHVDLSTLNLRQPLVYNFQSGLGAHFGFGHGAPNSGAYSLLRHSPTKSDTIQLQFELETVDKTYNLRRPPAPKLFPCNRCIPNKKILCSKSGATRT